MTVSSPLKVCWWRDNNNFGDCLTPFLLKELGGISVVWSHINEADLIGAGSLLEFIPHTYKGIIFGSGRMFNGMRFDLRDCNVLALRGKLTKESCLTDCEIMGDLGLLCNRFKDEKIKKEYFIGVISHWNHQELIDEYPGALKIDITGDVKGIIEAVQRCERIVSSSLHGLVLADAMGIMRKWVYTNKNPGEGFKFYDYHSIFGDSLMNNEWYMADQRVVSEVSDRLFQQLLKVKEICGV
ncbi:MAG: hypothetical protein QW404_03055 [Candidatus Nanoarchaeia archaeon]